MTREEIEGLVAAWVPRLGLTHWHVRVEWDGADDDAFATAHPHHQYDDLIIRPNLESLADKERAFIEWTVVHELLHAVLRDLDQSIEPVLELLPRGARELARARYLHESEGVTDRLAGVIVALQNG